MLKILVSAIIFTFGASSAEQAAPVCYAGDFKTFLTDFSEQLAVQQQTTLAPLDSQWLVDGEDDPKPVRKKIPADKIKFPVFDLKRERTLHHRQIKVEAATATSARVTVAQDDSDISVTYYFRKNPCWQLVRMVDNTP